MKSHEPLGEGPRTGGAGGRLPKPKHLLLVTALSVFLGELLVMLILAALPPMSTLVAALTDGVMITIFATPFLYLFLFRPMEEHIRGRREAEHELRQLNERLEHLVAERTRDLEHANRELSEEVQKHRSTAESLRRSNEYIERVVERAPCLVLTFDADSLRCIYVNSQVTDILGYGKYDMPVSKKTLVDGFIAPEQKAAFGEVVQGVLVGPEGEVARGTCGFISSSGQAVELRYGLTVLSRTATMEPKDVLLTAMPAHT